MKKKLGFTLVELMIVVAIIAIVAAIAIPSLIRSQIMAKESSTIGSLRSIGTGQAQFQKDTTVDQETDGIGEFGTLSELTGASILRAKTVKASSPFYLPQSLAPRGAIAHSSKSGYNFQIFLPGVVTDDGTNTPTAFTAQSIIDTQESKFRIYCWPVASNGSGLRCFAINEDYSILASANANSSSTQLYSGTVGPAFDAACDAVDTATFEQNFKIDGVTAKDGQIWLLLK